jgi:hypothetical protein
VAKAGGVPPRRCCATAPFGASRCREYHAGRQAVASERIRMTFWHLTFTSYGSIATWAGRATGSMFPIWYSGSGTSGSAAGHASAGFSASCSRASAHRFAPGHGQGCLRERWGRKGGAEPWRPRRRCVALRPYQGRRGRRARQWALRSSRWADASEDGMRRPALHPTRW